MKYAIFAGLNGGFGGAIFQYVDDFDSEDEALGAAHDKAVEEYESYEGCHGLMDWEDVRDDLRESFGEEPGEDYVRERYLEEVESWLDYSGALSTDEVDEVCMALTTIKLYIQGSVPRAE